MDLSVLSNASKSLPAFLRKTLDTRIPAYLTLLAVILLIVLRDPRYLTQPRFWAEEGTLHFAYSFSHPWFQTLFKPQVGYLNFWPNLATLFATLVPLEKAPLVTTLMAFIIQLAPIAIILWSQSELWSGWLRKLAGVAVVLFVPLTGEVWLNSINSFNYFAVITFLILFEELPTGQLRRWVYRILLVLSGLTGTLACFLAPLFLFEALREKKKERWIQLIILSVFALIQVLLILFYKGPVGIESRANKLGLATAGATLWTQSLGLFIFGYDQAHLWAWNLFAIVLKDMSAFSMWGRVLLVVDAILLFLLSTNLRLKQRLYFLYGYLVLLLLTLSFSAITDKYTLIQTGMHGRLFLAPNIILGCMILTGVRFVKERGKHAVFTNLVSALCLLVIGASLFWGIKSYSQPIEYASYWPDWSSEVTAWRANPNYQLHIQPGGWLVKLDQK